MESKATSVEAYLANLPDDRRAAIATLRQVILEHLPEGYEESMQYGMIGYAIPLSRYPNTYNGQPLGYVALASQKNYISLYLMGIYSDEGHAHWFRKEHHKRGKKLDMGKSCVRFKRLENVDLDLIGQAVALLPVEKYIELYERSRRKG